MSVLHPHVVLSGFGQCNSVGIDTKVGKTKDVVGHSIGRGVNQLSIEFGIDLGNVFHIDTHTFCPIEHLVGLHGTSFIPPQEAGTSHEQDKTCKHTTE